MEEVASREEKRLRAMGYEELSRRYLDQPDERTVYDSEGNERAVEVEVFVDPDADKSSPHPDLRAIVSVQPRTFLARLVPSGCTFLIQWSDSEVDEQ